MRRTLKRGDPVWYRPRQADDYGFGGAIPAVFLGAYATRTSIRLLLKDGTQKHANVLPRRVRPRVEEDGMPVRFVVAEHLERPDRQVVEVWIDGTFVATITARGDSGGVRLISKYPLRASVLGAPERSIRIGGQTPNVIELDIRKD
jgi:hypothetical protein